MVEDLSFKTLSHEYDDDALGQSIKAAQSELKLLWELRKRSAQIERLATAGAVGGATVIIFLIVVFVAMVAQRGFSETFGNATGYFSLIAACFGVAGSLVGFLGIRRHDAQIESILIEQQIASLRDGLDQAIFASRVGQDDKL